MGKTWFRQELTHDELRVFIHAARNGAVGNALIGQVGAAAQKEVHRLTGTSVTKIVLEGTSIVHADNPKHNLDPDDLEKCVEVINNPLKIKLLPRENAQGLKLVEFEGNITGALYFAMAVHKKNKGWLSLASAYRPEPRDQRLLRYPMLRNNDPRANVQNDPQPAAVPNGSAPPGGAGSTSAKTPADTSVSSNS